jgi:hypothetical protein
MILYDFFSIHNHVKKLKTIVGAGAVRAAARYGSGSWKIDIEKAIKLLSLSFFENYPC